MERGKGLWIVDGNLGTRRRSLPVEGKGRTLKEPAFEIGRGGNTVENVQEVEENGLMNRDKLLEGQEIRA